MNSCIVSQESSWTCYWSPLSGAASIDLLTPKHCPGTACLLWHCFLLSTQLCCFVKQSFSVSPFPTLWTKRKCIIASLWNSMGSFQILEPVFLHINWIWKFLLLLSNWHDISWNSCLFFFFPTTIFTVKILKFNLCFPIERLVTCFLKCK